MAEAKHEPHEHEYKRCCVIDLCVDFLMHVLV